MMASLNEIEQTAQKAARGAGFPWGLAEEIGVAARWLAGVDLDAVGLLAGLLRDEARQADPATCPIRLGVTRADKGPLMAGETGCLTVRRPVWLLPFATRLVQPDAGWLLVTWRDTDIALTRAAGGVGIWVRGSGLADGTGDVTLRHAPDVCRPAPVAAPRPGGRPVDPAAWAQLGQLEARTYVPASRQSRASGAGAGTSDND